MKGITVGEWHDPPELNIVGIGVVRSDRAAVTRNTLSEVLETILRVEDTDEARKQVYEIVDDAATAIENGEMPLSDIAKPKGMNDPPEEYGTPSRTPMPTYRGAKYANQHLGQNVSSGDKPYLLYISRVRGDYPHTYTAETAEDGDDVDAVAMNDADALPDNFVVNRAKMVEKTLEDPLTPILSAMNWSFEDCRADTEQSDISSFW